MVRNQYRAVRPGHELAPHVVLGLLVRLLHVVAAIAVRLPHVEHRALDRAASGVRHPTGDHARLALAVAADVEPHLLHPDPLHVEGTEDRRLRPAVPCAMVDRLEEHGDAERVGEQDPFLAPVVAHLAGGGQEVDGLTPFLDGRLVLLHEGMEVPDGRLHDLPEARSGQLSSREMTVSAEFSSVKYRLIGAPPGRSVAPLAAGRTGRYQRSSAARSEPRVPTQRSPCGVDSFFPERRLRLEKVHDELARRERIAPGGRRGDDEHDGIARGERTQMRWTTVTAETGQRRAGVPDDASIARSVIPG